MDTYFSRNQQSNYESENVYNMSPLILVQAID